MGDHGCELVEGTHMVVQASYSSYICERFKSVLNSLCLRRKHLGRTLVKSGTLVMSQVSVNSGSSQLRGHHRASDTRMLTDDRKVLNLL